MALDKRIKEKINEIMNNRPNITVDELMEIVKEYAPKPDTEKLIKQEYRRMAQRIIASYRDEKGVRECFSVKSDTGNLYVNISNTKDKEDLKKVRQQLSKKYRGLNNSLRKIDIREQILDGQITMEELMEKAE
ncbi:hypothetical protein U732_1092 [Clostridium argentinense CDC 2741]|uniref:Uncharacterized protein n=1 Tax=Clostridium argentinense CDC 2741 TaxID=1418104 RepID=A0A0C1R8H9_9CLOT|nr:hypothetical protein [Clostridium argentinense]ARC85668.1 hypothetical protein RSJ17_14705 [Clostridium argentinense]KIE46846.1 hypothetical protein U732_1092 [Clostridium argentinense CDC 2741]NFF40809.1 hypothetical protein [Clostridium argentinense]NFP50741.1 hypothetical protein [Clostridium argentinense]NFP73102.1 hypothetical protein [Clostridium argentinense]